MMGNVYVEHRAVFIGGWGPSYIFTAFNGQISHPYINRGKQ